MFKLNDKVTRKELTNILCKEEIESGLITKEKPLMMTSIIDGRFAEFTNMKYKIKWLDDLCKNGIVVELYNPSVDLPIN